MKCIPWNSLITLITLITFKMLLYYLHKLIKNNSWKLEKLNPHFQLNFIQFKHIHKILSKLRIETIQTITSLD